MGGIEGGTLASHDKGGFLLAPVRLNNEPQAVGLDVSELFCIDGSRARLKGFGVHVRQLICSRLQPGLVPV